MGKVLLSFFIFMGFAFSSASKADAQTYLNELEQLSTNKNLSELIRKLNSPQDSSELMASLDWLKPKVLAGFGGARMLYHYSINLSRAGIPDTPRIIFIFGMLVSRSDAERCVDKTAPIKNIQEWEASLQPLLNSYMSLPMDQKKKYIEAAVNFEEKTKSRKPDYWVCSGGMASFIKFQEKHKDNPNAPVREINDKSKMGKTLVYNDPSIEPDYVSDDIWNNKRLEIRNNFIKQMLVTN